MKKNLKSLLQKGRFNLSALALAIATAYAPAKAEPMRIVAGEDGVAAYAKGVLKIVLSKLPERFEWDESTPSTTEARITQMLIDNKLDLVWLATTNDFEDRLHPIRIPLYKGLFGYRIFMIKRGTQNRFEGIQNLQDITRLSIGQGRLWADTDIMEANGIDVVKVTKYESLFYMLDGDRFDAFPRGVHEPWYEMARYPDLELTVEKNIMMSYPNAFYFFVNKDNTALAEKIERGFRIAIEDGSFDEYFFNDPTVTNVLKNANLASRKVIKLRNPLLPPKTPLEDKALWFDPSTL
ncbi:extracellular solute-binding protein (family 3) [Alteromonadaceae bacterium 2753L.S.0a.02]|nr:extracellular solute-binding protein (family 3) [Alteromonadaceae bacterium 2753L.S.0a.02]